MKTRNVGNLRRQLSVSDGQIPTVGISFLFLSSMERGDDTWRGIPDRLVNETYVSRHSSMYIFFGARTNQ
jgi:hypothetical protein